MDSSRPKFNHQPYSLPTLVEKTDETGRWYTHNDVHYQSVTSYISKHWDKSGLDQWRVRIGQEKAEHVTQVAVDRGHSLHGGIERYLMNEGAPKYDNPHNHMLFVKVKPNLDRIDNIRLLESPLFSPSLQLAGRPDCIAEYDGSLSVIDIKTSGKVKLKKYIVSYFLQCGFYGKMAMELYGETVDKAVIIMATEDSPTAQVFVEDMETCVGMVQAFVNDPVKFQKKMVRLQKTMRSHGNAI